MKKEKDSQPPNSTLYGQSTVWREGGSTEKELQQITEKQKVRLFLARKFRIFITQQDKKQLPLVPLLGDPGGDIVHLLRKATVQESCNRRQHERSKAELRGASRRQWAGSCSGSQCQ